eukprot:TCONS_00049377-protein
MDKCPVCKKTVSDKCNSIQCDICDLWTHQHKCSGLSRKQFQALSLPNSPNWYCPVCINNTLPGSYIFNNKPEDQKTTDFSSSNLNDELKTLLSDLNKVVTGTTASEKDEEDNIQFHNNSCSYLDCNELNDVISKNNFDCSAFHLNIASMSKHFDKLINLLALINSSFSFVGISETRSLTDQPESTLESVPLEQKSDFTIPGYEKFFTPTESSAGGVSLYISKKLLYKPRQDLSNSCYQSLSLESVFVEVILSNRPNILVGNIYRHPCMSIKTFNEEFLQPLLHKIKREKKQIILLGDFNIDLLKCEESAEASS